MSFFRAIETSASGLTAERLRMDIIANNIANVNTTRTENGGPYQRQMPVFAARSGFNNILSRYLTDGNSSGSGVRVTDIRVDPSPFKYVYNPTHPDADARGYVAMPNVNIVTEMVDMITASRAYEANITAINTAKSMALRSLEIGR
ncbi:MAG: flagellar basal body rod protein FlgC [bacterium]